VRVFPDGIADGWHCFFRYGLPLTAFHAYITGNGFAARIDFAHPALQKCGFTRLAGRMKYPVKFVSDVTVQLSAYQTLCRRKHVMSVRIAGSCGIKKSNSFHIILLLFLSANIHKNFDYSVWLPQKGVFQIEN
jgi:hypothetical protein